ncbi:MAG TPA: hypothetical protein VG963_23550 [Polyangiaceae bacterium]|nr:hypothetical protein [Polyangiaceae bacterium]
MVVAIVTVIASVAPGSLRAQDDPAAAPQSGANGAEAPQLVDPTTSEPSQQVGASASRPAPRAAPEVAPPAHGVGPTADEQAQPWRGKPWARTIGLGVLGVASGFVLHELGHITANLMLGNKPHFEGTRVWGFLPFVVISPGIYCHGDHCVNRDGHHFRPGREGNFFIVTAGFHMQHITDEVLLSLRPRLRYQYKPLQKGLLLMNVALSVMYAAGGYTGLEDPHGDLTNAAAMAHMHEAWLATLLLVPAALDVYRYFAPDVRWSPWVSRAAKTIFFGLNFVF